MSWKEKNISICDDFILLEVVSLYWSAIIPLVGQTRESGFAIDEVSADKAYSSRHNHNYINQIGAVPFIAFRSNATGKSDGSYTWMRMYRYYMYNRDEFLEHYHNRSNVESTFFYGKIKIHRFGKKQR